MDASNSDNDISLSPSHLLGRLQVLRQLQIMQRGKLQKQRLQYQSNSETSSSIAEMISHFTNSYTTTSYNSFQSLLQSPQTESPDESPRLELSISQKVQEKDLIDGVSILNLSKESEFIMNSPISSRSGKTNSVKITPNNSADNSRAGMQKKQISLDDMPILSPKTDFETLVLEKLKDTNTEKSSSSKPPSAKNKKPYLRRGEGMSRFGLKKKDLVVQNTNSLPWRKKSNNTSKPIPTPVKKANKDNLDVEILVTEPKLKLHRKTETIVEKTNKNNLRHSLEETTTTNNSDPKTDKSQETSKEFSFKVPENLIQYPNGKHPVQILKGKTWASVLSKEQTDFLSQLKQSEYYKNFTSPTKSVISETSCDESLSKLAQEREMAEQNLFELLENKATNESFLESSFINRFLKSKMDFSGESTPLVMQKCLEKNPNLLHIVPEYSRKHQSYEEETCQSECSECCSDEASTVSSCCSCRCTEPPTPQDCIKNKTSNRPERRSQAQTKNNVVIDDTKTSNVKNGKCQTEKQQEEEAMKVNMVEMNEKLISTSELLKERLQELEDEIETFRKENMSLNKMKEEVDIERQKFYEEKQSFEQKFNEEKILTEYHLAEEKEKLNKQKLIYERYVREMRGRLNKKEKDEVVNLKQEIRTLKEDIRLKDAKSTSIIARLRNQLKIMEKEKTELQNEVEKLKKENRRIQHSNDITRRMSNLKYLQEINKKLNIMGKDNLPEVEVRNDVKYKGFEIERQSRSRKQQIALQTKTIRPRAKSVPNINVTSKYAKYFSQRDTASHFERNTINIEHHSPRCDSEDENIDNDRLSVNSDSNESVIEKNNSDENNLEKIYVETFRSASPVSNRSANSYKNKEHRLSNEEYSNNGFFLRKSNSSSSRDSKSPGNNSKSSNFVFENDSNRSKSPISILSNRSKQKSPFEPIVESHSFKSKSPTSIHSNHSSRLTTVIQKDLRDKLLSVSPEPSTSKTSSKTNLNPLEIKKPDGSKELRFPNGNVKHISADGKYSKFVYYNGDVKENFLNEGRIIYFYAETKTYHTTHADGHEVLEFPDGQVEKRYKDGSTEIRLPNGSVRYHDPKNKHVREEWRFPDGASLTVSANGEQRIVFANGQIEVHAQDHKRREFPDGTVKLVYNDGTSETRYASGRVRIKDKHGNLIMDSAPG